MDIRVLKEILAAHADQLVSGKATSEDYLKLLPESEEELASLLTVAERVKSTLRPIEPTDEFEEELKRQLLTAAHLRQVEGYTPPHPFRDLLLIILSVIFIVSLAAVMLAMRQRT